MQKSKYLWITDPHLFPWKRKKFLNHILDLNPYGVFLTGDISHTAITFIDDLEYLGKKAGRPIYFVCGNHDIWFSDFETVYSDLRILCSKYKNLIWMQEAETQVLTEEVGLIGVDGFYSADHGDPKYLKYTLDYLLIKDFRDLSNMDERVKAFKHKARVSAELIKDKLIPALEQFKTIYILTHVPICPEANRDPGTILEPFWQPYNINSYLGKTLEEIMIDYKKRNIMAYTLL